MIKLADKATFAEEVPKSPKMDEQLRAWLEMLWLRPATGLQKALELKLLGRFLPFQEPAADLGCGDGTHSSLICGARFFSDFDMYLSVADIASSKEDLSGSSTDLGSQPKKFLQKADTEKDYYQGSDAFLHFDATAYESQITYRQDPVNSFDWSCDLAASLVKKAQLLKVHKNAVVADLSKPLNVNSGRFKTIYSNVSYWMENKGQLFSEKCRALHEDGVIFMTAQDPSILANIAIASIVEKHSNALQHGNTPDWVTQIDRGRRSQVRGKLLSIDEWKAVFSKCGLEIFFCGKYMSRDAYWHYDLDLRETFPSDVALAGRLARPPDSSREFGREMRARWKQDRVEHFYEKWQSFYYDKDGWQRHIPRAWNFFALKKVGKRCWAEDLVDG
jgi:hypothetical protein